MAFLTQGSMDLGADTYPEILPKRFALKFDKPTIIMEYLIPSTGKLYHHNMRIKNSDLKNSAESIYARLRKKHSTYLDPTKISEQQVIDLIHMLQKAFDSEEIIL